MVMNPWAETITSLLWTCKQVHDEARGELYYESCLRLIVSCSLMGFSTPYYPNRANRADEGAWLATHQLDALGSRYEGVDGESDIEDTREWGLSVRSPMDLSTEAPTPSVMHEFWPLTMAELSTIEIAVRVRGRPRDVYGDAEDRDGKPNRVNQFLYGLVSVLNEGGKPQLLRIGFQALDLDLSEQYSVEMLYPLTKVREGIQIKLHCRIGDDAEENKRCTSELRQALIAVVNSEDPILRYDALDASAFGIRELDKYIRAHEGQQNIVIKHARLAKQRLEDFYHGWNRLIKREDERYIRKIMRYVTAIAQVQEPLEGREYQWEEEWGERFKEIDDDELMEV